MKFQALTLDKYLGGLWFFFFPSLVFLMIQSRRKNLTVDQVRKNTHVRMRLSAGKARGRKGGTVLESFRVIEDQGKDTVLLKMLIAKIGRLGGVCLPN